MPRDSLWSEAHRQRSGRVLGGFWADQFQAEGVLIFDVSGAVLSVF